MKRLLKYFYSDPLYLENLSLSHLKALAWAGFLGYPSFTLLLIQLDTRSDHHFWERWLVGSIFLVALILYHMKAFTRQTAYRVFALGAFALTAHIFYMCHVQSLSSVYALLSILAYCLIGMAVPTRGTAMICLMTGIVGSLALGGSGQHSEMRVFSGLVPLAAVIILLLKNHFYNATMDLIYTNEVKSVLKNILEFTMDSKDLQSTLPWAIHDVSCISWCRGEVTVAIFVGAPDQKKWVVREVVRGDRRPVEDYRNDAFYEVPLAAAGKHFGFLFVGKAEGFIPETTKRILLKTIAESLVLLIDAHFKADEMEKQQAMISHSAKMVSLGEMAGGIAHEINTPLTTISVDVMNLKILRDENLAGSDQFGKILNKIESTVDRVAQIISGLLLFARDGSHDLVEETAVDSIIDDTLNLCLEKFKSAGVKLIRPEKQSDLRVSCQKVQIHQVLLNLLGNSYDAIEDLSIERRYIRIELASVNDMAIIKVIDGGDGPSREAEARLFQPFFTTKQIGKGTGLGLSISKKLITEQKGRLYYESAHPETCFIIELPLVNASRRSSPASA